MKRKIIKIDGSKCNGCGLCVRACHEGAIGLIDGKAQLLRDDYCDGLGDCLPVCPTGAISFEERRAAAYNEQAVQERKAQLERQPKPLPCGCAGTHVKTLSRLKSAQMQEEKPQAAQSYLNQWPIQLKLVPPNAPYFENAHLLIAADCTAYAYGGFHKDFIKGKVTLIGCPKLDGEDYSEKLTEIIKNNYIKSIMVVRMEVPCCSGLEAMVKQALAASGKVIPWSVKIITVNGGIVEEE